MSENDPRPFVRRPPPRCLTQPRRDDLSDEVSWRDQMFSLWVMRLFRDRMRRVG